MPEVELLEIPVRGTTMVLVGHDWGVALAMDRLRRHPDDVRGWR